MARQDPQAQHRARAEKLVERIASDPAYRQRLLDDPVGTLIRLRGLEYQPGEEVAGYVQPEQNPPHCRPTCTYSCWWSCGRGGTCKGSCGSSQIVQG